MIRSYLGPSSGGTTVCLQQLVLIFVYIQLYLLMMGIDTPETCRSLRNILIIKSSSSWFFFTTTVTDYFFANKVPKMLFFCADYIFTTYAPLADEKENNFSRKFVRGTCRIYPCNDNNKLRNKLRNGRFSRIMNIWKLPLCSELLYTCWPQLLAALYLCHYIFSVIFN